MSVLLNEFNDYLNDHGFRHSEAREQVAKVFFNTNSHIGIEDLYERVRKEHSKIGIATVYRTLNLLVDSGLALKRDFDTGAVTYERRPEEHHDHLICSSCKKVIEFHNEKIEKLQDKVAAKHGFELTFHKMELYGLCSKCVKKRKSSK